LQALVGIDIRQSGPFSSARVAARHRSSSDSAKAAVFNAAKIMIEITEPRVESDFISVVSIAHGGIECAPLRLYADHYRAQTNKAAANSNQATGRQFDDGGGRSFGAV
jgi:hypothetical protein